MPFPEHYLLQFGGDLRSDIWSCGVRFSKPSLPFNVLDETEQETLTEDLADDVVTWMTAASSGWATAAKLRYVKFNRITALGRYQDTGVTHVRYFDTAPYPTGSASSALPNQVALAVSWKTAAERGRASKGRIFMPTPALQVDGDTGYIVSASSQLDFVAQRAREFILAINNQPGLDTPGVVASVVSRVDATSRPITGVRVGNVLDTIRTRRNALEETYTSSAAI